MAKVIEEKLGANAEEAAYRAQAFKPAEQAIEPIAADVAEMQSIAYGDLKFAIDTFEASLDESGKATSGVKAIPGISMSWYAAKDACEAAGKRLCTEREWLTACQGALAQDDDGDKRYADDKMEGAYTLTDRFTGSIGAGTSTRTTAIGRSTPGSIRGA